MKGNRKTILNINGYGWPPLGQSGKRCKTELGGPHRLHMALTTLKSCNLHFPDFFLITKMGVLKGDTEGWICPAFNCSLTKVWATSNFSLDRGHCRTQTRLSDFHLITSVVPDENPDPACFSGGWTVLGLSCPNLVFPVLFPRHVPGLTSSHLLLG